MYRRDPKAPASPLREEYEKLRDSRDESKDLRLGAIAMEFTRKKEALLAENVLDRTRARTTRMGRFAKRKLFDAIHRKFTRQMERLKEEAAKARGEVYREVPPQSWAAWLQEQAMNGRVDALEALRKRAFTLAKKGNASLRGEVPGEPSLIPGQRIDGITKRGTVIYDLGRDAIRDDGDAFRLGNGAVPATDILALQLAKQRFGSVIFADGDRAFKARMVRAAVEGKVFIKFGDPDMERQRNELFKSQYQERKRREEKERLRAELGPASATPGVGLTPEEIRQSIRNATSNLTTGGEHAPKERPSNGHDRDSGTTRGASMSR